MNAGGVGLVGRAEADRGGDLDHAGLVGHGLGRLDRLADAFHVVVAIGHVHHVPAIGLVALQHVLGERHRRVAIDGDVVVVVEGDQLAQAQVAGQGGRLTGDALLMAAVTHDHVGVVIDQGVAGLVEVGRQVRLGDRQAHGVGDALAQGASGDLNAGGFEGFGVAWGLGAPLAELLEILHRHRVVAGEVQQGVEQHAAVAGREHEAVAVEPLRILGVVPQHLVPQGVGHGGGAHRQARMARIRFVDRINRQEADAVDAERLNRGGGSGDHGSSGGVGLSGKGWERIPRKGGGRGAALRSSGETPDRRCGRRTRRSWRARHRRGVPWPG